MKQTFAYAATIAIAIATVAGCGSDGSDGGGGPGSSDPGTGPGTGPGTTPSGPTDPQALGELRSEMQLGGFHDAIGFVHRPSRRLVSFPSGMTATLRALTAISLDDTSNARVDALSVTGTPPDGRLERAGYDLAGDRFILLVRGNYPRGLELCTVQLGTTDATFTPLTSVNLPGPNGAMFDAVLPKPGGVSILRGNGEIFDVTIQGQTATWSGPQTGNLNTLPKSINVDLTRSQRVGFGADVFVPGPNTFKHHAGIYTQPFGSTTWTEVPMTGTAPPDDDRGFGPSLYSAYDESTQKIVVVQDHEMPPIPGGPPGPNMGPGLWIGDLQTGTWSIVKDFYNGSAAYGYPEPFAVDTAGHRAIMKSGSSIAWVSLEELGAGDEFNFALDGRIPPRTSDSATRLPDGRVLVSDGSGYLQTYDPKSRRFDAFGQTQMPLAIRLGHLLIADPGSGRLFLFGGSSSNSTTPAPDLYEIAQDGSAFTKIDVQTGPEARHGAAATATPGHLFIAGGSAPTPSNPKAFDDVWDFDVQAGTWKKLATLEAPTIRPAMSVLRDGRLLVAGGSTYLGNDYQPTTKMLAIDPKTGQTQPITVDGEWPTRKGIFWSSAAIEGGFVAVDSGDTVDSSGHQIWRLLVDGDHAKFTGYHFEVHDDALNGLVGVNGAPTRDAWIVGRNVWAFAH